MESSKQEEKPIEQVVETTTATEKQVKSGELSSIQKLEAKAAVVQTAKAEEDKRGEVRNSLNQLLS